MARQPARSPIGFPEDFERWRGSVETKLETLIGVVKDEQDGAASHRAALRDSIGALSQSMQLLAAEMRDVKPLVEDYRTNRDEGRGAAKFKHWLWITFAGLAGGMVSLIMESVRMMRHWH